MPRMDKVDAFRDECGENASNERDSAQSQHTSNQSDNSNKDTSATIDLTPFLREPKYSLEEVIHPQTTKHQLDLILAEVQYQDLIYNEWGMGEKHKLDKALSINLAGPPGTGKTLTAEAIAHAFKNKIIVVPYQQVESKYVGETPKNIAKAFEFATEQNAVLFFDEADSFLGRRLENVTQSTDTAVNLTRSVMIVQLSSFEGIVIFATNLVHNYDPAFVSRIRWKVKFDLPNKEAREKIWKAQIPSKLMPVLDKTVNFENLASQFDEISGRDIKNALFQAVVAAAIEDKPKEQKFITQSHLVQAMNEVIEANKAASKQKITLNPVEDNVELPPEPPNITFEH